MNAKFEVSKSCVMAQLFHESIVSTDKLNDRVKVKYANTKCPNFVMTT